MNREYHQWHSPALGRTMEVLVFGHAGARVLAFPVVCGPYGRPVHPEGQELRWSRFFGGQPQGATDGQASPTQSVSL